MASKVVACVLGLTVVACAPHAAKEHEQKVGQGVFESVDINKDSIITPREWDHHSFHLFLDIDKDIDGRLSPDELDKSFTTLDQNGDGRIDTLEAPFLAGAADANGDHFVNRAEFEAFDWAKYKVDANNDGKVSAEEFRRARRELFNESDFDRDGRIEPVELDDSARIILFRF